MNPSDVIELRSDTMTRPTPAMREAIARAEVGDDVFGEDPTVNKLEQCVADLLGTEEAMFVPSGTMGNQTAIRAHTEPGQEIIGDIGSHFFHYETAGAAALSGCSVRLIHGERGVFTAEQVQNVLRDPDNPHLPQSRLIVIENTHNRGGGTIWPLERVAEIRQLADANDLAVHMDGARLMNACVATGRKPTEYTQYVDTVTTCFSKGLGAPVGSALAGPAHLMRRARRFRKMFGGAMRQAGVIAAAALYALENHVERLAEDHANAQKIARALAQMPGIVMDPAGVQTNLLFFDVESPWASAADFVEKLREVGVLCLTTDPKRVRMVTSLEATGSAIDEAIERIGSVAASPAKA